MLAGGLNATATTPVDHRSDVNRSDERRSAVRSRLGSNRCRIGEVVGSGDSHGLLANETATLTSLEDGGKEAEVVVEAGAGAAVTAADDDEEDDDNEDDDDDEEEEDSDLDSPPAAADVAAAAALLVPALTLLFPPAVLWYVSNT